MRPELSWLPEWRFSELPPSRWAVPGHAPAFGEAEHCGGRATLSGAVMSGAGSKAVSCWNCFRRKPPSPPLSWPHWWFCSFAPPQISCVSPGCATSALMGGLAGGVWESPALPQSGLRMAKGQTLMAFPTGKCPPTEWYFPKATFCEGQVASGLDSPRASPVSCNALSD